MDDLAQALIQWEIENPGSGMLEAFLQVAKDINKKYGAEGPIPFEYAPIVKLFSSLYTQGLILQWKVEDQS